MTPLLTQVHFITGQGNTEALNAASIENVFRHRKFIFPHRVLKSLSFTWKMHPWNSHTPAQLKNTSISNFSSVSASVTGVNKSFKASKYTFFFLSHSVSHCNQSSHFRSDEYCVQSNYNIKAVVRVAVLWKEVSRCNNRLHPFCSIRPSSTGRVAFTESSDIVMHSLVSSLFVYRCSYGARSNSISFSKDLWSMWTGTWFRVLTLVHTWKCLILTGGQNRAFSLPLSSCLTCFKGNSCCRVLGIGTQSLWPCDLQQTVFLPVSVLRLPGERIAQPGPEKVWLLMPFLRVWTHA